MDEVAGFLGLDVLSVYFDLEKFYDSIDVVKLIELSVNCGFSLHVAAMDLQVHMGLRILSWAGCYSHPLAVSNSILAGSKFSNTYARTYLYDVL